MKFIDQLLCTRKGIRPITLLAVGCGWSLTVGATTFSSGLSEVEWKVSASVFECSLSHPVTAFGSAAFARRAGEAEFFSLKQQQTLLRPGQIQLQALLPSWHGESKSIPLGTATIDDGKKAVHLDAERALQVQRHLEEGRRVLFSRSAEIPGQNPVRVILQPLYFSERLDEYRACLARLLPVNFKQIERTAIYFPEMSETLSAAELRKLELIVRYVKADTSVRRIIIDAHTDSDGVRPENLEISKSRAEFIASYLVERALPADALTTRWHGERYPVASNKTPAGRAQNRRVTLRLERDKS
jgi:outer membrane protein OmpA-like peptidoglycan-associated protein